jgi:hypothetical protein
MRLRTCNPGHGPSDRVKLFYVGQSMEAKLDKYRRNANECRQEATRALNRREKQGFLKIADYWLKLAKKAAKESRRSK